jgi:hypothetical protein
MHVMSSQARLWFTAHERAFRDKLGRGLRSAPAMAELRRKLTGAAGP